MLGVISEYTISVVPQAPTVVRWAKDEAVEKVPVKSSIDRSKPSDDTSVIANHGDDVPTIMEVDQPIYTNDESAPERNIEVGRHDINTEPETTSQASGLIYVNNQRCKKSTFLSAIRVLRGLDHDAIENPAVQSESEDDNCDDDIDGMTNDLPVGNTEFEIEKTKHQEESTPFYCSI